MFKEYFFNTTGYTNDLHNFILQHSSLLADDEIKTKFWCDEQHTLGLDVDGSGIKVFCGGNGDVYTATNRGFTTASDYYTYIQQSKDGTVTYLAQHKYADADNYGNSPNLIIAKDQGGDWAILVGGNLYYKNGYVNIGSVGVEPNYNSPFSATQVFNIATETPFPELYKINSATIFKLRGTYVNFNGQGYRCVDGRFAKISAALPCYAFPVADES